MAAPKALIDLPERYRPLRHVANGGMAAVWLAEDTVLGREVAIKLLSPHLTESDSAVARFEREARAAAGLSANPGIVTIYDVGEHEGRPFIVMEAMHGGTVADRLREGRRPSPEEAVAWLRDTAVALDAAHKSGIVHRDVKPGNMLFDDHDRVALADFGIARVAYDPGVTSTGEILGTAAYISPEQADGAPASAASDVYALAVVAFELLTGTRPFSTGNFAATARQHVEAPPPRASERNGALTPEVDDVLVRAMAKDPKKRWPSATAFVDALDDAIAGIEPAPADATQVMPGRAGAVAAGAIRPPLGPLRPLEGDRDDDRPSSGRRRPRAALLLVGLALLALLVGAIALIGGGGDSGSGTKASASKAERDARAKRRAERRARARERARQEGQTPATATPPQDQGGGGQPGTEQPSTGGSDPAALNDQGFALMNQGKYGEAIPVLQKAVDACGGDVSDLTCAYATFNLGKSLRLGGRPAEAIPILERRLQNPDQRAEVESELALARAAAGQGDQGANQGGGNGAGKPGKGPKKSKPGKGEGGD
jgi:serine/threonine-protein kinase